MTRTVIARKHRQWWLCWLLPRSQGPGRPLTENDHPVLCLGFPTRDRAEAEARLHGYEVVEPKNKRRQLL